MRPRFWVTCRSSVKKKFWEKDTLPHGTHGHTDHTDEPHNHPTHQPTAVEVAAHTPWPAQGRPLAQPLPRATAVAAAAVAAAAVAAAAVAAAALATPALAAAAALPVRYRVR